MVRHLSRALPLALAAAYLAACSSMSLSDPGSWIDTAAGGGSETSAEKTAPPPPSAKDKPPVVPASQVAKTEDETSLPVEDPLNPTPRKPQPKPSEAAAGPTEFPNLANQPEVQTAGTTASQRREIRDSLVADRDKAQHSGDVLRGGTETPAAPPPPAPAKPAEEKQKTTDGNASTPSQ